MDILFYLVNTCGVALPDEPAQVLSEFLPLGSQGVHLHQCRFPVGSQFLNRSNVVFPQKAGFRVQPVQLGDVLPQ